MIDDMSQMTLMQVIEHKVIFSDIPQIDQSIFLEEFRRRYESGKYTIPPLLVTKYANYLKGTPYADDKYQYLRSFRYLPPHALYDYYTIMRTYPNNYASRLDWNTGDISYYNLNDYLDQVL